MQLIATTTGTSQIVVPFHQPGDLLVIFAYRDGSNTAPTVPSGWRVLSTAGANTNSAVVAYRYATVDNYSVGTTVETWTSATTTIIAAFRNAIVGDFAVNGAASTTVNYPAISVQNNIGTSRAVGFAGHRSVNTSLDTPPSGMTNVVNQLDSTDHAVMHMTSVGVSSWSSTNVSIGGSSSGWRSAVVEIKDADDTKIRFLGSATGTTTATLPPHKAGDLIVAFSNRDGNTTAPSLPGGWTNINNSGANTCSARLAYIVASNDSTSSGTWTNATSTIFCVYRNAAIGNSSVNGASSATVTFPALTLNQNNGTSWVICFSGHRSVNGDFSLAPLPMRNITTFVNSTVDTIAYHSTNSGINSWSSQAVATGATASGYRAYSLELIPAAKGLSLNNSGFTEDTDAVTHLVEDGYGFRTVIGNGGVGSIQLSGSGLKKFEYGGSKVTYVPSSFKASSLSISNRTSHAFTHDYTSTTQDGTIIVLVGFYVDDGDEIITPDSAISPLLTSNTADGTRIWWGYYYPSQGDLTGGSLAMTFTTAGTEVGQFRTFELSGVNINNIMSNSNRDESNINRSQAPSMPVTATWPGSFILATSSFDDASSGSQSYSVSSQNSFIELDTYAIVNGVGGWMIYYREVDLPGVYNTPVFDCGYDNEAVHHMAFVLNPAV